MAADTYSLQALVLRKTKLGETDLIVTLLAQDGRQVRAVAKGARKPNSSFATRLEIFSEVDLLLVCGKSLDIVKEAKLFNAHIGVREDMEHAAAAASAPHAMRNRRRESSMVSSGKYGPYSVTCSIPSERIDVT